jgi:ribosomal protein S27E
MSDFLAITCPHCGEEFEVSFDPGEGGAEFITDCEICCRPITVTVHVRAGRIESVQVQTA